MAQLCLKEKWTLLINVDLFMFIFITVMIADLLNNCRYEESSF